MNVQWPPFRALDRASGVWLIADMAWLAGHWAGDGLGGFHPDLVGWEEKGENVSFPFVAKRGNVLHFVPAGDRELVSEILVSAIYRAESSLLNPPPPPGSDRKRSIASA